MKYSPDGVIAIVVGTAALLFRKLILPRIASRLAEQQYRSTRPIFGEKFARLTQRRYEFGARLGLLLAGIAFIIVGVLRLFGFLQQ